MSMELKQANCRIMELEQENGRFKKRNRDAYSKIKVLKAELEVAERGKKQAVQQGKIIRAKGAMLYAYTKWAVDRLHRLEGLDGQSLDDYEKSLEKEFNERPIPE